MVISQEERDTIREAVAVAKRKFDEKWSGLCRLTGAVHGGMGWKDMGKWFGLAAMWMYDHDNDPALENAGIRIVGRDAMCAGKGSRGRVLLQLDDSGGSVELEYEYDVTTNTAKVTMPGEPGEHDTVTGTIDSAAWALRRLDELMAVAVRYSKVMEAVKARELCTSRERVEKARHQLELLEKL